MLCKNDIKTFLTKLNRLGGCWFWREKIKGQVVVNNFDGLIIVNNIKYL